MNERIRELAKQAGDYANEVFLLPVRSKEPGKIWEEGHVKWHELFNQKFAELIIRECVDYVFSDEYERSEMFKHFGVEP